MPLITLEAFAVYDTKEEAIAAVEAHPEAAKYRYFIQHDMPWGVYHPVFVGNDAAQAALRGEIPDTLGLTTILF
jgi:hypothetical protein